MAKGSCVAWEDRLIDGLKPRYSFNPEKWYLGKPCKHGCLWPGTSLSLRSQYRRKNGRRVNHCACRVKGKAWLLKFLDLSSIGISDKHTLLPLCGGGHDWKNTGFSLKYKCNQQCLECEKARRTTPERKEYMKKQNKAWYQKNKEAHIALARKNYLIRCEKEPEAEKCKRRLHSHTRKARLKNAHSVPGVSKKEINEYMLKNFEANTCVYCGVKGEMHLDHFFPLSKGGPNVLGNLVPACPKCNNSKKAKDPREWYFEQPFATKKKWLTILGKINTFVTDGSAQFALF